MGNFWRDRHKWKHKKVRLKKGMSKEISETMKTMMENPFKESEAEKRKETESESTPGSLFSDSEKKEPGQKDTKT